MKNVPFRLKSKIFFQGLYDLFTQKPICVSFEVTHSCTGNCRHCDKGGIKEEKNLLSPQQYGEILRQLNPPVVQLSGGEPLLRKDIVEIVRVMKQGGGLPFIILVTNGSLLTEKKYVELKEVGLDRVSVSLDFPDQRHNTFRRIPGLYQRLERLLPRLAKKYNYDDIALNSAITQANLPELLALAKKAQQWGIKISYSAYSILRTGDRKYFISAENDLQALRKGIKELIRLKMKDKIILNAERTLDDTYRFFRDGMIPHCQAGRRFLVVRPDGYLNPCSMFPEKKYVTQAEVLRKFTAQNKCGECYVAIRAYTEKSPWQFAQESLKLSFS
jgi:MoaA/NifB/PqqE/SkfB family radical SAM enzyme